MNIHFVAPRLSTGDTGSEARIEHACHVLGLSFEFTDLRAERYFHYWERIQKPFDLTLAIKAERLTKDMAKALPHPSILWFPDHILVYPVYQDIIWRIGKHFDVIYSFDPGEDSIQMYRSLGCRDVRHLPPATETDLWKKTHDPKVRDVAFLGTPDLQRLAVLKSVKSVFPQVEQASLFGHEAVRYINQTRIMLNCGRGETDTNQRVFETLVCGTFLLTNIIPEEYRLFQDGVHLVYWSSLADLNDKISYYLSHEAEREKIAEAGRQEVLTKHLHRHRLQKVLSDIGKLRQVRAAATMGECFA